MSDGEWDDGPSTGGFGGGSSSGGGFGSSSGGGFGSSGGGFGGGSGGGFGSSNGGGFGQSNGGGFGGGGGGFGGGFGSSNDDGQSRGFGGGNRGGGGGSRACFKCGEEGHMSRECPKGGGGGGGSRACFKCGEEGHMSRECPTGGGGGGGNRACYKCGEEGHMSRECPQGGGGGNKSGGFGGGGGFNKGGFGGGGGFGASGDDDSKPNGGGFGGGEAKSSGGFGGGFGGGDDKPSGGFGSGGFGGGFGSSNDSEDKPSGGFGGGFGSKPSGGFGGGFGGGDDDAAGGGFGSSGGGGGDDTCRICKQSGHFARECPDKPERDDKCRRCGESGHFAKDCTQEPVLDPNRPAPVTYVPPEPSEDEVDLFRTSIAQGINFDNYDSIPVEITGPGEIPAAIKTFDEAELPDSILTNVKSAKYKKPTPVQKYSLPVIMKGRDLMSCAQTGSGKTAAFLLPVLSGMMGMRDQLTSQLSPCQAPLALVIAPTRELATQIYQEARKFSHNTSIRPVVVYGGVSVAHQSKQVQNGCHLLVGTPGRLKDFVNRGKISLENLKYLILDEADRMLDMGFMPEVKAIVGDFKMPAKEERQTLMFSATFPEEIQKLAAEFLNSYVFLTIGKVGSTSSNIDQVVYQVDDADKRDKLVEILTQEGGNRNLVFVQTKRLADFLASYLCQNGFPTTSIHGDRYQQQREEALREFRSGQQTVLVATAVAARGLDIEDVKQVINYDLPEEIEEYIHRIGRTGRIGNKGRATSFFCQGKDEGLARALVKTLSDSEQNVPDWLDEIANQALGTGYGPKGGKFASKDTRRNNFNQHDDRTNGDFDQTSNGGGGFSLSNGVSNGGDGGDDDWD